MAGLDRPAVAGFGRRSSTPKKEVRFEPTKREEKLEEIIEVLRRQIKAYLEHIRGLEGTMKCVYLQVPPIPVLTTPEERVLIDDQTYLKRVRIEDNRRIKNLEQIIDTLTEEKENLECSLRDTNSRLKEFEEERQVTCERVDEQEETIVSLRAEIDSLKRELALANRRDHIDTLELKQSHHVLKDLRDIPRQEEHPSEEKYKYDAYSFLFNVSNIQRPPARLLVAQCLMEVTCPDADSEVSYTDLTIAITWQTQSHGGLSDKTVYKQLKEILGDKGAAFVKGIRLK